MYDESTFIDPLDKFGKKMIRSPDKSYINISVGAFEEEKTERLVLKQ